MIDLAQVSDGCDRLSCGLVGQDQVQLPVDLSLAGWVCRGDDRAELGEARDQGSDVLGGHAAGRGNVTQRGLGLGPVGFGGVDPRGDLGDVSPGVDGGPVAGHLGVAVADALAGCGDGDLVGGTVVLGIGHGFDGLANAVRGEFLGEPCVQARQDLVLADEYVTRMADLIGQGVFSREPAPLVGQLVGPVGLHLAVADAGQQPPGQGVGVAGADAPA
jgi:hypothetical protein